MIHTEDRESSTRNLQEAREAIEAYCGIGEKDEPILAVHEKADPKNTGAAVPVQNDSLL